MTDRTGADPRVWVVRAGRRGEDEESALAMGCAIIGFREFPDLVQFSSKERIEEYHQRRIEPGAPERRSRNFAQQLWMFRETIREGDVVVLPLKNRAGQIALGRVAGPYQFRTIDGTPRHTRAVTWTHPDVPRSTFKQDLLHSFGAFITVCRIQRNDAERRIQIVLGGGQDPGSSVVSKRADPEDREEVIEEGALLDLEQAASDEIVAFVRARFPDHEMARLVEAVLQAEGFVTRRSPPGPDGGADILAGRGPLGLDAPYLCVQVKATQSAVDVKVLRELAGTMSAFKATQGLLVSWGGFTQGVTREARQETFKIRLWDQSDLVQAIYRSYDKLLPEIQAELPLKKVWILVREEGGEDEE